MTKAGHGVSRGAWALAALCAAGACLPLAVGIGSADVPSWLWVVGGLLGLCSATRLLLGMPLRRDGAAQGLDFEDEMSASRNAELHAELLSRSSF